MVPKAFTGCILTYLAQVAGDQGELDTASAYLEQALSIWRGLSDQGAIAGALHIQGRIAHFRGDLIAARTCFAESAAMWQMLSNQREIARCLEGLAAVAADQGRPDRACRLFAAAAALRETGGPPPAPIDRPRYERQRAAVLDALRGEAFAAAWAEGRAMAREQAVAYALE